MRDRGAPHHHHQPDRRERYVGPWLPEPAVEGLTDLADEAALSDSLSTAFLLLLERLTPEQRAVLLLRDVFDLSFAEVAEILGRTEESCRQLLSRRGVARVLSGPVEVARMVSAAVRRVIELDAELEPTWVGSQPAVLIVDPEGALVGVWSLDVDRAEVRAVHGVVNPAKLGHLGLELTDWASMSRRAGPSSERPHQ